MEEVWKTVKDIPDYEISSYGRLRSTKRGITSILKERINHDGYAWYILCMNGRQYSRRAHRLVAEAFIPNPEGKPTVNHLDGDKRNNHVENLEWATRNEQMIHAYAHNLKAPMRGCLQKRHVLTEEQVREIRSVYKGHDSENGMIALSVRYGVSTSTIFKCVKRTCYQNVE